MEKRRDSVSKSGQRGTFSLLPAPSPPQTKAWCSRHCQPAENRCSPHGASWKGLHQREACAQEVNHILGEPVQAHSLSPGALGLFNFTTSPPPISRGHPRRFLPKSIGSAWSKPSQCQGGGWLSPVTPVITWLGGRERGAAATHSAGRQDGPLLASTWLAAAHWGSQLLA